MEVLISSTVIKIFFHSVMFLLVYGYAFSPFGEYQLFIDIDREMTVPRMQLFSLKSIALFDTLLWSLIIAQTRFIFLFVISTYIF